MRSVEIGYNEWKICTSKQNYKNEYTTVFKKKRLYDRIKHKVKIKYILPKRARIITVKTDYIIGWSSMEYHVATGIVFE